jgi:hypothetical protein
MAAAGCLYHTSWIIDDQPWPINVRGGQKFIYEQHLENLRLLAGFGEAVSPSSLGYTLWRVM